MYWTVYMENGPKRVNHAAVAIGDLIYSFGGYCTGRNYKTKKPMDVHVLDTVTMHWKSLPLPEPGDPQHDVVPYKRYGHTAVFWNGKAYIWGGRNDEFVDNILYCFDPGTCKWTQIESGGFIPSPRDGHSACVIKSKMYVFGGYDEVFDHYSDELYVLNFLTMTWSPVKTEGKPPSFRDFHTATVVNDRMYIFGGRGDHRITGAESYSQNMHFLDTISNCWHKPHTTGDIPVGRRSHSAFLYGDHIFIFGGFNSVTCEHFNDMYRFCVSTNEWQRVTTKGLTPSRRRRQACLVIGHRAYMFGGTSPVDSLITSESQLIDHSDLYVLEFVPSLKTLSILIAIESYGTISLMKFPFPKEIKSEIYLLSGRQKFHRGIE
ncbi:kelch domain-containing protein 3 [Nilaparvata lugens]|uniref:kelch domain-containing protein 3 n=1 Tax=Nilaparvata lugens TaxID=108931 RepID=UPI00193DE8A6|nr:kelch domain-containing protein 3 [Nilaparvata lugens]